MRIRMVVGLVMVGGALVGFGDPRSTRGTAHDRLFDDATCSWSPAGPVSVSPGNKQTFFGGLSCTGYEVTLNPISSSLGFNSSCTLKSFTTSAPGFVIYNCSGGSGTIEIRLDDELVQTIDVNIL